MQSYSKVAAIQNPLECVFPEMRFFLLHKGGTGNLPIPPFAVFSNGETLVELLIDLDDKVGAIFGDRDTFDRLFALHFFDAQFLASGQHHGLLAFASSRQFVNPRDIVFEDVHIERLSVSC